MTDPAVLVASLVLAGILAAELCQPKEQVGAAAGGHLRASPGHVARRDGEKRFTCAADRAIGAAAPPVLFP